MGIKTGLENGRVTFTISPKGIENVAFLNSNREASLDFYTLISSALDDFEKKIKQIAESILPEDAPERDRRGH